MLRILYTVVSVTCTRKWTIPRAKDQYLCCCGMKRVFGCTKNRDKWLALSLHCFLWRAIVGRFTQDVLCVWASLSSAAARVFVIQLHSKMRYKKIRTGFRRWNESLFRKAGDDGTSVRRCDVIHRWSAGWDFFLWCLSFAAGLLVLCAIRWAMAVLLTACNINFLMWTNLIPIKPEQ